MWLDTRSINNMELYYSGTKMASLRLKLFNAITRYLMIANIMNTSVEYKDIGPTER